ncbi:MAG: YHS domain-containing (seleno)protein [Cyanobacteria bacterium J06634_6]
MKQHALLNQVLRNVFLVRLSRSTVLLAATLSVAIGITACGPTTTTPAEDVGATEQPPAESSASASSASTEGGETVYVKDGVAIAGADPVAYFTDEQFVPGSAEYTHEWKGTTWQFASAENRDLFADGPEAYAPQYGGYCAWAVGQNALAAIDPNAWSIVDGKLYLNANKRIQDRWSEDIPGNIALAEDNWPGLSQ